MPTCAPNARVRIQRPRVRIQRPREWPTSAQTAMLRCEPTVLRRVVPIAVRQGRALGLVSAGRPTSARS